MLLASLLVLPSAAFADESGDLTPPPTPTGLRAVGDSGLVRLSWEPVHDEGGSGLREVEVWRDNRWYDYVDAPGTSYVDTAPVKGVTYQVRAVDRALNRSGWSRRVQPPGADTEPPAVPVGVTVSVTPSGTEITWDVVEDTGGSGLREVEIWRDHRWYGYVRSPLRTFTDTKAVSGAVYRLRAVDNALNFSSWSVSVSGSGADTSAPPTPGGLQAGPSDDGWVQLTWVPVTDSGGSGLREYAVFRNGRWYGWVAEPATSFVDQDPIDGAFYQIQAIDHALNRSALSTQAIVRQPSSGCDIGGQAVDTRIHPYHCAALLAIGESLGVSGWIDNSGWMTPTDPCDWFGVRCVGTWVTELRLGHNGIRGHVPPEIGDLPWLRLLELSGGDFATLPPEIGKLSRLESLEVSHHALTQLPTEIGNLTQLKSLYVGHGTLTELPASIGQLTELVTLWAHDNAIEELPPTIGDLSSLEKLHVWGNELVVLRPEVANLEMLEILSLSENELTELPPELGQLSNLRELIIRRNRLRSLPAEVGELGNLYWLDVTGNQLTELPASIGQLQELEILNAGLNQLTELPATIGDLTSLTHLHLSSNRIASLPPELSQLSLTSLVLWQNALHGDITPGLAGLADTLATVNLSENNCLTTTDQALGAVLDVLDPDWGACR